MGSAPGAPVHPGIVEPKMVTTGTPTARPKCARPESLVTSTRQRERVAAAQYEGPSVMEVVNMSIQELEAKAQQVEARAATLAASRGERRDAYSTRTIAPVHGNGGQASGYAADAADAPTEWELERLAQELPVVEARRAEHIGKLATRIDSALRHVDGLSTHLDDLATRPAPPPLPSSRAR